MARVLLIHWNASEAGPLLAALRGPAVEPEHWMPDGIAAMRQLEPATVAVFVISLDRVPSRGRDVALALRQRKATRAAPLIFAGGDPAKVVAVRRLLPDAHYTEWGAVGEVLAAALREMARPAPVVPPGMAAYAGAPLVRKLGIKPDSAVVLVGAPPRFERKLEPLPAGATVSGRARRADRVLLFAPSLRELVRAFRAAASAVNADGALWILWPKRTSGIETDLSQGAVRQFGLDAGWVDYKICAVDETWSGLCFARRARKSTTAG